MTFEQQQAELMQKRACDNEVLGKRFLEDTHPVSVVIGYQHFHNLQNLGYHRWCHPPYPGMSTSYSVEPAKRCIIVCCENVYAAVMWKLRWGET